MILLAPKGTKKPPRKGRFAALAWPQTRRGRPNLWRARLPMLLSLHALMHRPGTTERRASFRVAQEHLAAGPRATATGEAENLARMLRRDYQRHRAYITHLSREMARAQGALDRHWQIQGQLDRERQMAVIDHHRRMQAIVDHEWRMQAAREHDWGGAAARLIREESERFRRWQLWQRSGARE